MIGIAIMKRKIKAKALVLNFAKILLAVQLGFLFSIKASFAVLEKIDTQGQYLRFPGITVISNINEKDAELWGKVYQAMSENKTITDYYSFLPLESYHMTLMNLFTERYNGAGNWKSFVDDRLPWFQNLNDDLQAHAFEPQGTIGRAQVSKSITVLIDLRGDQSDGIYQWAKKLNMVQKVPEKFHVTLAYQYKKPSDEALKEIDEIVNSLLKKALHSKKTSVSFKEPQLSIFYNMTHFIPWDGKSNPF
jgi:hypothetical protein